MSNITFGDFILLQIALLHYLKDIDLSTRSGVYISKLLGKIEYNLALLESQSELDTPLSPPSPTNNIKP